MNNTDLASLMHERAYAYQFLACAFRTAPDAAFFEALVPLASKVSKSAPQHEESFLPLWDFLTELHEESLEDVRSDVAADYARMFLNMSPNPVSLYESVYTSPERLLMQQSRDQVVEAYCAAGFISADDFNLPEDHLSCELELMALLATQTGEAFEGGHRSQAAILLEQQHSFICDHLRVWVPEFCENVGKQAQTTFFREIADMLKQQIDTDFSFLGEAYLK